MARAQNQAKLEFWGWVWGALVLRLLRVPLRLNQIAFAYAAYYEPWWAAVQLDPMRGWLHFVGLHPPLYSAAASVLIQAGGAPLGLLLFSGLCSSLAVGLLFRLGLTLEGRGLGRRLALLGLVSVYGLHYGLEINNYPLLLLLGTWQQLSFVKWWFKRDGLTSLFLIISSILCAYTHILAGGLIALQLAWSLLFLPVGAGDGRWKRRLLQLSPFGGIGLACVPLLVQIFSLVGRSSTYQNGEQPVSSLLLQHLSGGATRFGGGLVLVLAGVLAGVGLLRVLVEPVLQRRGLALLPSVGLLPLLWLLMGKGVAAAHQYPYYLLPLPGLLALVALGVSGGLGTLHTSVLLSGHPWRRVGVAGGMGLAFGLLISAQTVYGMAELRDAWGTWRQFRGQAHGMHTLLHTRARPEVLWLIAPPRYEDDDKRAFDPVYTELSWFTPCYYYQPAELHFEYVDYRFGQPYTCGNRVLYTFTEVYSTTLPQLLAHHRRLHQTVTILLYDVADAAEYPRRLKLVLEELPHTCETIHQTLLCEVKP